MFAARIEYRKLASLHRVARVGIDLAYHVNHRIAAGDQQAGLPVGREIHVAGFKRATEGAARGLLAGVRHVERVLALPLGSLHARVEGAQRHHVAQPAQQILVRQIGSTLPAPCDLSTNGCSQAKVRVGARGRSSQCRDLARASSNWPLVDGSSCRIADIPNRFRYVGLSG